jgi:hypothetical protein
MVNPFYRDKHSIDRYWHIPAMLLNDKIFEDYTFQVLKPGKYFEKN